MPKILFCSLMLLTSCLYGQDVLVNENNPATLKWYQLNTKHFRVLYPKGFEFEAQRMANTLQFIHDPEAKTMGASPRKISVILQNQSAISNAFVSITPRRSEFYGMPSQNYNFVGNSDWLNLLATHEYRHIVQFQHATRGFNKLVYYAFGANGLSLMSSISVPQWFWEGDAVATETAFTQNGRGRIPNFDLVFRTNLLEGRTFTYDKQYLRSYKNNIPDHYKLGFHLVSYLRKKTANAEIWENITKRTWQFPVPSKFSWSIKKESGTSVKDLYNEMAASLKKEWQAQLDTTRITSFEKINKRTTNSYTDYRFPQMLEDGSILAQKSGIGDIEQLVAFKNGKEKKIYTQGIVNDAAMLSATNLRVVWNEFRFDPRWRVKTFSTIVGYDLGSQTKRVIAKNGRYASAAISFDGYQVATVETKTDYQTKLVVLDYLSGKVIREFENPTNDFISMPRWATNKEIIALKTNKNGKAIVQFSVESGQEKIVSEYSSENIGHPVAAGKYILYNSPISGIDNIYALDTESGKRYQITSSKYGSYNPAISRDGNLIYYNEQGKDGLDIVKINFDPATWVEWRSSKQPSTFFAHLAEQEGMPNLLSGVPDSIFKIKRYSRLKGIINPYSWGPYTTYDLTNASIGITSKDLLGTTNINAGYFYDITEKTGAWKATVSYQGWYPIIDFSVSKSNRKSNQGDVETNILSNKNSSTLIRNLTYTWDEQNVEAGLRLPFLTTNNKFYSNITFSNSVGVTKISNFRNTLSGTSRIIPAVIQVNEFKKNPETVLSYYPSLLTYQGNGNLVYNHFKISASRLLKQSRRDINSKWGQAWNFDAFNTPYGGNYSGSQISSYLILFFPGLIKHHSIWSYGAYQYRNMSLNQSRENYQFRNKIPLPRGISVFATYQNFYSFSGNYTMPIWYPDLGIRSLLNIQRIRLNGFYDYGYGSGFFGSQSTNQFMSTGVEVKFDINVVRLLPQFDIGFRYSYGIKPSTTLVEVLIGTFNF